MSGYYIAGTISLINGSAAIVGTGTAWKIANVAGGTIFVQGDGNALPLASIEDDTHATAALLWTGATGTYSYALLRATAASEQLETNSNILTRLLAEMDAGTLWKYEVAGNLAGRSSYDARAKGFSYLAIDTNPAQLYIKASATSGDWSGPFSYGTGPQGPQGDIGPIGPRGFTPRGTYSGATAYVVGDGVLYNGSTFICVADTTDNAPPTLPTTSNTSWQLVAIKGTDGTGTGDVVGPAGAVADRIAVYDGTTGKLLKDGGVLVSDVALKANLKWQSRGIGETYRINTALTGVDIPPSSTSDTVWIELTAGLTGVGAFNNGKLTSESVSGSAPLINATAVINVTGSPMNGQTIRLANTEGRIDRPSTSPGTLQDDAFQGHKHLGGGPTAISGSTSPLVAAGSNYDRNILTETDGTIAGGSGTPRTANETRMRNQGVKAYMRVK